MRPAPLGGLPAPDDAKLDDQNLERMRRALREAILQLQQLPASSLRVLPNVQLADGVPTAIAHGLGRLPVFVRESTPRGPSSSGRVEEIRDGAHDRTKVIVLKATGYGATVTVDVQVL